MSEVGSWVIDNTDKTSEWRLALSLMFVKNVYSLPINFTRQEQWLMITFKQQHLLLSHSRPTTANRKNWEHYLTATQIAREPHCYIVADVVTCMICFSCESVLSLNGINIFLLSCTYWCLKVRENPGNDAQNLDLYPWFFFKKLGNSIRIFF